MDADIDDVLAAIERRDWETLRLLLHPYLHWTDARSRTIRGRTKVLGHLATAPPVGSPSRFELRDGQVYRWVEPGD